MDSIINKDWEILIMLDGCRYDYFNKYNIFSGKLNKIISPGISTKPWLLAHFGNEDCSSIIHISPDIKIDEWLQGTNFFKIVKSWSIEWSNDYGTVLPEDTADIAIKYIKKYRDKRIIVHFLQPHLPFLSEDIKYVKETTIDDVGNISKEKNIIKRKLLSISDKSKHWFPSIPFWFIEKTFGNNAGVGELYFNGGFERIQKAYSENIKRVLISVKRVLKYIDRKVVITADHGTRLGEMGMYGHGGWRNKCIVEVPWFEVEDEKNE